MEFSEEWKTLWPISSTLNPPILLRSNPSSTPSLGPLFFNPIPNTSTSLFSSPSSLCPSVVPPPPSLSLPRFLQAATSPHAPVLQSTSTAIAPILGTNHFRDSSAFDHNRLEHLCCPNNWIITFFPTGDNLDRVGFVVLAPSDSGFRVDLDVGGKPFVSLNKFNHRIFRLSACPVDCASVFCDVGSDNVGFLMACTMYSVHWFSVRIRGLDSDSGRSPVLEYLGGKLFKSCAVAHACWNPHLPEESVVLLENGELFLFDVSSPPSRWHNLNSRFRGKRLSPLWDELGGYAVNRWFSCGFSWHPRILIVVNSNAVFLVDFRFEKYHLSCLLKIESLSYNSVIGMDRFVAFSEAGPDRFHYAIATDHLLLLCDIRKLFRPLLQWLHGMHGPRYLASFRLSELRSNSNDVTHKWASEEGFGILLGSFWNDDFILFCYGPHPPASTQLLSSRVSKFGSSFYAWELPSRLLLASHHCFCGSCLLRLEFAKDDLPEWIQWQQKKELVLGFFIVDNSFRSSKLDDYGGFTLVRLMSSGKLEAQRYRACWNMLRINVALHREVSLDRTNSFLYPMGDKKFKFSRKFKYLKFEYLCSHLNDALTQNLFSDYRKDFPVNTGKENLRVYFHEFLCEKLKAFGFNVSMSSVSVADFFRGIIMPNSISEVASRRLWATLPMDVLELAFSNYSECLSVLIHHKKTSLDFLAVPDQTQLPPFILRNPSHRSNKWSSKVKRGDDYLGPVLPLPVCLALSEIQRHGHSHLEKVYRHSPDAELTLQCEEVMHAAKEVAFMVSGNNHHNDSIVSLGDDREETWNNLNNLRSYFLYEPTAFSDELFVEGDMEPDPVHKDRGFTLTIAGLPDERVKGGKDVNGVELFDDVCPVTLNFDTPDTNFDANELKTYQLLKGQFLKWQVGFTPHRYTEFAKQLNAIGFKVYEMDWIGLTIFVLAPATLGLSCSRLVSPLLDQFAVRLLALAFSRIVGASVRFWLGGWNCLRDVVVQFRKGAVESVSVGEVRLSIRELLVNLGVGFLSRDPKLQLLICGLEVVMRPSSKGSKRTSSRKSRRSGKGKSMAIANVARFLSVSVTDLVFKDGTWTNECLWISTYKFVRLQEWFVLAYEVTYMVLTASYGSCLCCLTPKATLEVKKLRVDISTEGRTKPGLSVRLVLSSIAAHLEPHLSHDQSSFISSEGCNPPSQSSVAEAEKTLAAFTCEELALSCKFGHDSERKRCSYWSRPAEDSKNCPTVNVVQKHVLVLTA
ncbi:hypothetical protein Dimus_004977 [Dionaea muscipula]